MNQIPLIRLNRVLHIGTMNPADSGRNSGSSSYEGKCLSVSVCPHAWRQIARLGGNPLHVLRAEDGIFLDATAIKNDEQLLRDIIDWGRDRDLVVDEKRWKFWTTDEDGEWRYSFTGTEEEAIENVEDEGLDYLEDDGPEGGSLIEAVTVPVASIKLVSLTGGIGLGDEFAEDFVMMAWAEIELPRILGRQADGIWWNETYDPDVLSAPRGAIFPFMIDRWSAEKVSWHSVDDERELDRFPPTEFVQI